MLVDLFADCLPNSKKKRWHFTTFMLETFAKLEHLRRSRHTMFPAALGRQDDYSLLWLARDMVTTSPILFLGMYVDCSRPPIIDPIADEFQLPDRAASKIISNLMTGFFHLGGVLIATSNRMPEELAKAAGMEFSPPPSRMESLGWKFGLRSRAAAGKSEAMFGGGKGELAAFLDVLKARCDVWEMEGGRDYRRREAEGAAAPTPGEVENALDSFDGLHNLAPGNIGLGFEQSANTAAKADNAAPKAAKLPRNYHINTEPTNFIDIWSSLLDASSPELSDITVPWTPSTMRVYGRSVIVHRQHDGVCAWTFDELCGRFLGPADYVSLAATFHTVILTEVPILSFLQKNEARRLITLLDALYEARCKLLISAAAGPDDIFFPETRVKSSSDGSSQDLADDAIYPETIAEIYQDATAPFRPNISSYGAEAATEPDYTHARLSDMGTFVSEGQLEDDPPNRPRGASADHGDGISFGRGDSIFGLGAAAPIVPGPRGPNFSQTGIYTGEDERFAYKRARSRLWEMCGARWWARQEDGWWRPVDKAVRRWEGSVADAFASPGVATSQGAGARSAPPTLEGMGGARALDEVVDDVIFKHGSNASPFRVSQEPPPKFSAANFWGVTKWGKKAGAWGQGPEGLKDRKKDGVDRESEGSRKK